MFRSARRSGSVLPLVIALVLNVVPLLTLVGVVAGAPGQSADACVCAVEIVPGAVR